MNATDLNKPLWQFTLGEMLAAIRSELTQSQATATQANETSVEYAYGIQGLADLLGCSKQHAWNIKRSGILDAAIIQNGRKIIVNKQKALELFAKNNKK